MATPSLPSAEPGLPVGMTAHDGEAQWVEVAYAEPDEQFLLVVALVEGMTVQHAIDQSGLKTLRPALEISDETVGLFSQKTTLDTVLAHRDRVEVYRPLINDPKDIRRRKAAEKVLKK